MRTRDSSSVKLTLPGVFAALGRNSIEAFTNLRPHQRHPWHAFLCQLGAIALTDGGVEIPSVGKNTPYSELPGVYDEGKWKGLLSALTPDNDAWSLVVADTKKPAFLQPPIHESVGEMMTVARTPDEIDIIFTTKNIDEKGRRITSVKKDHWIFALVTLQGHAGYSLGGAPGNYHSTVRQKGENIATRPGVGLITSPYWGDQWGRDCRVLIELLQTEKEIEWNLSTTGKRLLWLEMWDGKSSLSLNELHPYFLEICRLLRIRKGENDSLEACMTGTSTCRVEGKAYKGALDDPWIPIDRKDGSAFNTSPTWDRMGRILLDKESYIRSPAQIPREFDRPPISVRFCIIERGKSSTEEYHERILPVPPEKLGFLRFPDDISERLLNTMIDLACKAKEKVLSPAISRLFLERGSEGQKNKRKRVLAFAPTSCRILNDAISDNFFPFLWEALPNEGEETDDPLRLNSWIEFLRKTIEDIFKDVLERRLHSGETEFIRAADAELFFFSAMKKYLPLFDISSGGTKQ